MSYLTQLTLRLAGGAMRLAPEVRQSHARFVAAAQQADGGFPGRQGASDAYYTGFALRTLALVGELSDDVARPAAEFLRGRLDRPMPSVDFVSVVYSAVLLELTGGLDLFAPRERQALVGEFLDRFRCEDGGYAKTEKNRRSSTYHTFLAAVCQELVGLPIQQRSQIVELIRSRQRDDGGFVELAPLAQSGTNPTAAAVGVLRLLESMEEHVAAAAGRFLAGMQNGEGGLRANGRIPLADLLSTFTGMVALADLDRLRVVDLAAARRYVESLALPGGGFRGGAWDGEADVEYTFYGLGALALLESFETVSEMA
jgi:geranylgeranyl transferase type-2 subunit beta